MSNRILALVGSYHKNGVVDTLVSETLASAQALGATATKIYLLDAHIEFCRNCRHCTQQPGADPGQCVHTDDLAAILAEWKECNGLVLGAPVNFYNVTAVTRRFMERLVCMAYWPWGQFGPKMRAGTSGKRAVLITSSAMPSVLGRLFTGAPRALRLTAEAMGAKPVASIFAGMAAQQQQPAPSEKALRQARAAGRLLAS